VSSDQRAGPVWLRYLRPLVYQRGLPARTRECRRPYPPERRGVHLCDAAIVLARARGDLGQLLAVVAI